MNWYVFISNNIFADFYMSTGTNINFTSIHHVITFLFPGCSKFSTNAISSLVTKYSGNAFGNNRLCKSTAQSFLIPC